MCTDATSSSGAGTRPGRIAAVATASPAGGISGQAVGTATVTVAQRRASDIVEGDAIALPDEVFFPVAARVDGRRTWTWRSKPTRLQTNAHRWRWVYEVDQLDEDDSCLDDTPMVVGVVAGTHEVYGGDEEAFAEGLWATAVDATDVDQAEHLAKVEMLESL